MKIIKQISMFLLIPILMFYISCINLETNNSAGNIEELDNSNSNIYITYFGTACFLIEDSSHRILIDPGDLFTDRFTAELAENLEPVDLIIITHNDFDHCNRLEYIKGVDSIPIIGTNSIQKDFPRFNVITEGSFTNGWINIRKIDIAHGLRPNEDHTGYNIQFADKTIIFLGDGATPLEPIVTNPDILFVTIGGIEASVKNGVQLVTEIKPLNVIPMHWEILSRNAVRVRRFERTLDKQSTETKCIIPEFYETIKFAID